MALILNIETATDICSVCIAKNEQILSSRKATEAYSHASAITLLIEECTKEAGINLSDLEAVAVSSGPGSYTALRVGASTAKGICFALDIPLIVIDTLEALALSSKNNAPSGDFFIPMIDARRMEVYTNVFDKNMNPLIETQNIILDINSFSEYITPDQLVVFSGDGSAKSKELFGSSNVRYTDILCQSQHLVPLSNKAFQEQSFSDIAYFRPTYIKAPNITSPKKVL